MENPTIEEIDAITETIRASSDLEPKVGLVLGSGIGSLAEAVEQAVRISTAELAGWPTSTVEGHAGQLVLGTLEGQPVGVVQGRAHFYEGHSMSRLGIPIRVLRRLGAEILIVTNAAGGLNPSMSVGDLMLITDQIFLPGMAGHSPLLGPNLSAFGPRFPDMSQAYDRELRSLAKQVAAAQGFELREGVYLCLAGPAFETPAELRFISQIGADSVGMSTAHEVLVARHSNMRVLGVSGITNITSMDGSSPASHDEVLEAGQVIVPKLEQLIRGVLRKL
jgi:purine-nucleoside phosphorylase